MGGRSAGSRPVCWRARRLVARQETSGSLGPRRPRVDPARSQERNASRDSADGLPRDPATVAGWSRSVTEKEACQCSEGLEAVSAARVREEARVQAKALAGRWCAAARAADIRSRIARARRAAPSPAPNAKRPCAASAAEDVTMLMEWIRQHDPVQDKLFEEHD